MRCTFSLPKHGWLPVRLAIGADLVDFHASCVPNNPLAELADAIAAAATGRSAVVWWHLEPDAWYFVFSPLNDPILQLQIFFAPQSLRAKQTLHATIKDQKERLLLPLWRALSRLSSLHNDPKHWPLIDQQDLKRLRSLL